jgi:hypothetical protein
MFGTILLELATQITFGVVKAYGAIWLPEAEAKRSCPSSVMA